MLVGQEEIVHLFCHSIFGVLYEVRGFLILREGGCPLVFKCNPFFPSRMAVDCMLLFQAVSRHSYKQLGFVLLA